MDTETPKETKTPKDIIGAGLDHWYYAVDRYPTALRADVLDEDPVYRAEAHAMTPYGRAEAEREILEAAAKAEQARLNTWNATYGAVGNDRRLKALTELTAQALANMKRSAPVLDA
jgi:hypothetical protein